MTVEELLARAGAAHADGELGLARRLYEKVLKLRPGQPDALHNLGFLALHDGFPGKAAPLIHKALASQPGNPLFWNSLGIALRKLGRNDEARAAFQQATRQATAFPQADFNLGNLHQAEGRWDEAIAAYRHAIALAPGYLKAYHQLAILLCKTEDTAAALAVYRQALNHLGEDGSVLSALVALRQDGCDWHGLDGDEQRLVAALRDETGFPANPFELLNIAAADAALQLRSCRRYCAAVLPKVDIRVAGRDAAGTAGKAGRRLKIGYLSADFRRHPVARLIAPVLERHDRHRFEVIGYSTSASDGSAIRRRLEGACDRFIELQGSDAEIARRIAADRIDVLVDLSGHTELSRFEALAWRPAKVQVSYLGFPGSSGASFIDYIIVDPFLVPKSEDVHYSEKLVHLSHCYIALEPGGPAANTLTRADCGLPAEAFVFCCFNDRRKIRPELFSRWMALLAARPQSVLWLAEAPPVARHNLVAAAADRGIAAERLIFAPKAPLGEYLARLPLADLFLDTWPYNGGAVAGDALQAGLPVLTLAGDTYVGRMAGSMAHAAGLPELVTGSLDEYHGLALRLANQPESLAALRQRLVAARDRAPLFDATALTRELEAAYAAIAL